MSKSANKKEMEQQSFDEVAPVDTAAPAAKGTQYTTVQMDDGKIVDFAGKRKMLKTSIFHEDGSISLRLDFVNGETRTFPLSTSLLPKFAAHGAEQKYGDETAGLDDVEDCIMAVDELSMRLAAGEWGLARKSGNGMSGASILARALVEHSGKSMVDIKTFLGTKTQEQKIALGKNPKVFPICERMRAEKASKSKKPAAPAIDTEALLDEI